jgi:hypothetical protein
VRLARALALPVLLATVALVALLAVRPLSTSRALAIWLVLVAGIALVALLRRVPHADAPRRARRFEAALRRRKAVASASAELVRMERELELGIASAAHADRRLLPLLRAVAGARLGSGYGIELERQPSAARSLLGDDAWEFLRPDRPEADDKRGPGVPRERVVAMIERLESL